jgi:predicted MFS family arabinose efflux permease
VAGGLYFVADTFAMFMAAYAVQGVYRALDSGPLEAWYVDAALADDPDADISHGLSRGGAALGLSLAAGALVAGGLVALDPFPSIETLAVPVLASLAAQVVSIAAIVVLLTERRPGRGMRSVGRSVRAVPTVIAQTFGLLRSSKILRALVAVEVFWGFGMVTFEGLTPVRLSEVTSGGADTAAALMGPASSAAWIASAAGSAAAPLLARRLGVPLTAAALRILHGLTVAGMAVFAGPAGVIAAYLASYVIHGASNPLHMTLLHDQVTSAHRSTVISLNSMVAQPAASVGLVVLTALADATSVRLAIVVGAVVITLAAPLYLPARRSRRQPASAAPTADPTVPAS